MDWKEVERALEDYSKADLAVHFHRTGCILCKTKELRSSCNQMKELMAIRKEAEGRSNSLLQEYHNINGF